jgi:nucleoside-diphosphate-sugar epimerase
VLVVVPTGYIGKFVTKELISRGYNVVAFSREKAGIKGKLGKDDIAKVRAGDAPRGACWGCMGEIRAHAGRQNSPCAARVH